MAAMPNTPLNIRPVNKGWTLNARATEDGDGEGFIEKSSNKGNRTVHRILLFVKQLI